MNAISILMALLMLLGGRPESAYTLTADQLAIETPAGNVALDAGLAMTLENGGGQSLMDMTLTMGQRQMNAQACLDDTQTVLGIDGMGYAMPSEVIGFGGGVTGFEAVLIEGAAALQGVGDDMTGEAWLEALQRPLIASPTGFELDAAQTAALLEGILEGAGEPDAAALRAFIVSAFGRLTGRTPAREDFAGLLEAAGLVRLRYMPGQGAFEVELALSPEDWDGFCEAFIDDFGLQRQLRIDYAPVEGLSSETMADAVNNSLERMNNTAVATPNAQGGITVIQEEDIDPDALRAALGAGGRLEFVAPDGTIILDNSGIESADVVMGSNSMPAVQLQMNGSAAEAFAEATGRLIGQPISIVLDGEVIMAPVVQSAITEGTVVISLGDGTWEEAYEKAASLARSLSAGDPGFVLEETGAFVTARDMPLAPASEMPRDGDGNVCVTLSGTVEWVIWESMGVTLSLDGLGLEGGSLRLDMDARRAALSAEIPLAGERRCALKAEIPLDEARRPETLLSGGSLEVALESDRFDRDFRLDAATGSFEGRFSGGNTGSFENATLELRLDRGGMFGLGGGVLQGSTRVDGEMAGFPLSLTGRLRATPGGTVEWRIGNPVPVDAADVESMLISLRNGFWGRIDKLMMDGGYWDMLEEMLF